MMKLDETDFAEGSGSGASNGNFKITQENWEVITPDPLVGSFVKEYSTENGNNEKTSVSCNSDELISDGSAVDFREERPAGNLASNTYSAQCLKGFAFVNDTPGSTDVSTILGNNIQVSEDCFHEYELKSVQDEKFAFSHLGNELQIAESEFQDVGKILPEHHLNIDLCFSEEETQKSSIKLGNTLTSRDDENENSPNTSSKSSSHETLGSFKPGQEAPPDTVPNGESEDVVKSVSEGVQLESQSNAANSKRLLSISVTDMIRRAERPWQASKSQFSSARSSGLVVPQDPLQTRLFDPASSDIELSDSACAKTLVSPASDLSSVSYSKKGALSKGQSHNRALSPIKGSVSERSETGTETPPSTSQFSSHSCSKHEITPKRLLLDTGFGVAHSKLSDAVSVIMLQLSSISQFSTASSSKQRAIPKTLSPSAAVSSEHQFNDTACAMSLVSLAGSSEQDAIKRQLSNSVTSSNYQFHDLACGGTSASSAFQFSSARGDLSKTNFHTKDLSPMRDSYTEMRIWMHKTDTWERKFHFSHQETGQRRSKTPETSPEKCSDANTTSKKNQGNKTYEFMPFVSALYTHKLTSHCSSCFRKLRDSHKLKCRICNCCCYCDQGCKNADYFHERECRHLVRSKNIFPSEITRALARVYWQTKDTRLQEEFEVIRGQTYRYEDLQSYEGEMLNSEKHTELMNSQLLELLEYFPQCKIWDKFPVLYGKFMKHSMIISNLEDDLGVGMYLGLGAFEHSCRPNADIIFLGNRMQIIVRGNPEKVTLQFVDPFNPLKNRIDDLIPVNGGICSCDLCQDTEYEENVTRKNFPEAVVNEVMQSAFRIVQTLKDGRMPLEDIGEFLEYMSLAVGEIHHYRVKILKAVGALCWHLHLLQDSVYCYKELTKIYEQILSETDPKTIVTMCRLALVLYRTGRSEEAGKYFTQAYDKASLAYGVDHQYTGVIRGWIEDTYDCSS